MLHFKSQQLKPNRKKLQGRKDNTRTHTNQSTSYEDSSFRTEFLKVKYNISKKDKSFPLKVTPFQCYDKNHQNSHSNRNIEQYFQQKDRQPKRYQLQNQPALKTHAQSLYHSPRHEFSAFQTQRQPQSPNLIEVLYMENSSLKSTMGLIKEQNQILSEKNDKQKKDFKLCKKIVKKQEEIIKAKERSIEVLERKVDEYNMLIPKLDQLQKIQDSVMQENRTIKLENQMHQSIFGNVKKILTKESSSAKVRDQILLLLEAMTIN